ncbi:MAG: hypothetical protein CW335_08095 [Clostridiales bacterium]|nr:hypothetical protein [Clostridiales bacterium]
MLGFSKDKELKEQIKNSLVVLISAALIFFMIVLQKDYGTAIIFFIISQIDIFRQPAEQRRLVYIIVIFRNAKPMKSK